MKEVTKEFKGNEITISAEKQERYQKKPFANDRKIRGLTLFEYNQTTGSLEKASYKLIELPVLTEGKFDPDAKIHSQVLAKEDCMYFQSLNRKNAIKHVKKFGFTKIIYKEGDKV